VSCSSLFLSPLSSISFYHQNCQNCLMLISNFHVNVFMGMTLCIAIAGQQSRRSCTRPCWREGRREIRISRLRYPPRRPEILLRLLILLLLSPHSTTIRLGEWTLSHFQNSCILKNRLLFFKILSYFLFTSQELSRSPRPRLGILD